MKGISKTTTRVLHSPSTSGRNDCGQARGDQLILTRVRPGQLTIVVSGGKCSLLPSLLIVFIFWRTLDLSTRSSCDTLPFFLFKRPAQSWTLGVVDSIFYPLNLRDISSLLNYFSIIFWSRCLIAPVSFVFLLRRLISKNMFYFLSLESPRGH